MHGDLSIEDFTDLTNWRNIGEVGKSAEIDLNEQLELMTNLKMNLLDVPKELAARDFYGKVIEHIGKNRQTGVVRFTSVPPEVGGYFQALLQYAPKPSPGESS